MTEHPTIAAMMNHGYERKVPDLFSHCANCGQEVFEGEEYIAFPSNDNVFCGLPCVNEIMFEEGNLERKVAGDDTVRLV